MDTNLNAKQERSLSQKARDAVAELERRAREILEADVRREPKLNDEEKAEVSQLSDRIEYLRPAHARLSEQIAALEARGKHLNSNMVSLIIAGENAEQLVSEYVSIKPLVAAVADALHTATMEISTAERRIQKIKELAREREAQSER